MGVGGHNRRWHSVTCTKAKPPPWRDWERYNPNQGGLGCFGFLFLFGLVWFLNHMCLQSVINILSGIHKYASVSY